MVEIRVESKAYAKIILHAAKYPHCAVNGLLLARDVKKGQELVIVDAVPLFHICLYVTPMAEVALMQVDAYANKEKLLIAGYYAANELVDDMSIDKPGTKIAEKIAENSGVGCLAVVDNRKMTLEMAEPALRLMSFVEGKWKTADCFFDPKCVDVASLLLEKEAYEDLNDFDNHLDDLSSDWRNPKLNQLIADFTGDVNYEDEDEKEDEQ